MVNMVRNGWNTLVEVIGALTEVSRENQKQVSAQLA